MKTRKAAYTLEAVIVMSTIIFIIFAILSAFLLIYQNAVMFYVATQAAQEGAVMWTDNAHDLDGTVSGTDSQGLYYRIGELAGGNSQKEERIRSWAEERLAAMTPDTLVGSGAASVEAKFHNYVVRRVVEVRITKEVDIPFREIAQYFGADLDMTVMARASTAEPAEFIRNVDYAIELTTELWGMVKGKLGGLLKSR